MKVSTKQNNVPWLRFVNNLLGRRLESWMCYVINSTPKACDICPTKYEYTVLSWIHTRQATSKFQSPPLNCTVPCNDLRGWTGQLSALKRKTYQAPRVNKGWNRLLSPCSSSDTGRSARWRCQCSAVSGWTCFQNALDTISPSRESILE